MRSPLPGCSLWLARDRPRRKFSRHFPIALAYSARTGAGAEPRPRRSPRGRLSRPPLLGRLFPAIAHRRRIPWPSLAGAACSA